MKSHFKIRLCSDLDYEEMVADVCYQNYKLATITQEKGINNIDLYGEWGQWLDRTKSWTSKFGTAAIDFAFPCAYAL